MRRLYALTEAIYPLLQRNFPRWVTSTDLLAQAMLQLAQTGSTDKALDTAAINRIAMR